MERVRLRTTAGACRPLRGLGLWGLCCCLAGTALAADAAGTAASGWGLYKPRAIEVQEGHARFELAPTAGKVRHLLIVSSLNHEAGPFPIQLDVPGVRPSISKPPEVPGRSLVALPAQARGIPPAIAPATTGGKELPIPPARRNFHLMVKDGDVASASNYRTVEAELRGLGRKVQVYVDRADLARVPDATIRDIVRTFDDRIWPACTSRFGEAHDADRDGRFTIFLTGWLTRLSSGRVHVDGFVRGADFDGRLPAPFSNHSDMMYLSTAMSADAHLKTVLAHEYAHALIFSRKAFGEPDVANELTGTEEEGWLDEALAHLVEDLFGFSRSNLDYRVSAYLSQPERYRLVVEDYYTANLFRSHGNRGGTYLFLRWCVDRFGTGLLDALIRSPKKGVENLESATGAKFADLYREWTVALALSGIEEARAGLGGLHSVELRGEMDGWILAGPRTDMVAPGDPPRTWDLAGTSSRYFVIHSDDRQTVEVKLRFSPDADLQITAIRLPEDAPLVELAVTALRTASEKDARQLRFRIKERAGVGVRLGALAWEAIVPTRLQAGRSPAATLPRGNLDQLGIASRLGTSAIAGGRTIVSPPIGLGAFGEDDGPIVFKLLGVDAKGRRVTAWSVLDLRPGEELAGGTHEAVR